PPPSIVTAFHKLMAEPETPEPPPRKSGPVAGLTVGELLDKFLDWCSKHRALRTYADHRDRIQLFLDETPGVGGLAATSLRPFHINEWLDKHPTWGNTRRRAAIMSIQRPYNFAEEEGYIDVNPVRKIKKPSCGRREGAIS